MASWSGFFTHAMVTYKIHILVFLLALVAALTIAHPSILVTDEWVTTNQLAQLKDGHQIIFNEGKYGSYQNGTPVGYFTQRQNYLPYSLFLPIISLPAEFLVTLFGNDFLFVILYLWTFLLIAFTLFLNNHFPAFTLIGKRRWTTGLFIIIFVLFFINLFFYSPFPLTGIDSYPEIMAIVLTNIILFAIMSVVVYAICLTIFEDPTYSFLGTMVCISCSSYLFWANFCKDHILTAFLVTVIILLLLKFLNNENPLFLAGSFTISGLLAWARPELALFVAVALCIPVLYIVISPKNRFSESRDRLFIGITPLFTFIGAIPFFINNYLVTRNLFLPAFINWNTVTSPSAYDVNTIATQPNTPDTVGTLLILIQKGINIHPSTFLPDLFSIFFSPQNGSMGVFPLVPVFVAAVMLLPVLYFKNKISFSDKENRLVAGLLLIAGAIFVAYVRGISGMNISLGIVPDMRYLSPLYLPLTLVGLIIFKKVPAISKNPQRIIFGMLTAWIIFIPISLILISRYYPIPTGGWKYLYPPLDFVATIIIYIITVSFIICTAVGIVNKRMDTVVQFFFVLLCATPLIWQINASVLARTFGSGLGGYTFWIPIVLKGYEFLLINFSL